VAFGFLIGLLVDRVIADRVRRARIERFLTHPQWMGWFPRGLSGLDSSFVAAAGLALAAARTSGPLGFEQIRQLRDALMESFAERRSSADAAAHVLEDASRVADRVCVDKLAALLYRRWSRRRRVEFMQITISVAAHGAVRGAAPDSGVIRRIGEGLGLPEADIRRLLRSGDPRDREACAVLGVSPDASEQEIKRVYRQLATQFHPDTLGALDEDQRRQSAEAFIRIQEAYRRLMGDADDRHG
jgi:hypothetical protein